MSLLRRFVSLTALLALAVVPAAALAQEVITVPGERWLGEEEILAAMRLLKGVDPAEQIGLKIDLERPVDGGAQLRGAAQEKPGAPLVIGFERDLPPRFAREWHGADLEWRPAADGFVTTISVTSPGAAAMRLAIEFSSLPHGSEVRYYSPQRPVEANGPYGADLLLPDAELRAAGDPDAYPFWSPVVSGDTVAAEIWVPAGARRETLHMRLHRAAHLTADIMTARDLSDIGRSQPCERNLACEKKWLDVGAAVAKIIFQAGGGSFLCTGQLLADTDLSTQIPYFLTAAHCIQKAAEARSITFFWFFQTLKCNGANPTTVEQTGGGARLRFTTKEPLPGEGTQDTTLLELKRDPAPDVTLSGWTNKSASNTLNKTVRGIHHPSGDLKKVSKGKTKSLAYWDLGPPNPTHYVVQWKKGVTEGGSSGSGIWTGNRWPNQHLIGVLTGGASFCTAPKDPDAYGRFDEAFNNNAKMRRFLDPDVARTSRQ